MRVVENFQPYRKSCGKLSFKRKSKEKSKKKTAVLNITTVYNNSTQASPPKLLLVLKLPNRAERK